MTGLRALRKHDSSKDANENFYPNIMMIIKNPLFNVCDIFIVDFYK
jgi:hypothetical protein